MAQHTEVQPTAPSPAPRAPAAAPPLSVGPLLLEGSFTPDAVLSLQRTAGNRATSAWLSRARAAGAGDAVTEGTGGSYGALKGRGFDAHEIVPHAWLRAHGYARGTTRNRGNWSVALSPPLHYLVSMHQLDSAIRDPDMMAALSLDDVLALAAEALGHAGFDRATIAQLCRDARTFVDSLPKEEPQSAARSVARAAAPAAAAGARTHVVTAGETIATIARRYAVSADELAEANRSRLKRWQTPKGERVGFNAGEAITIPEKPQTSAPPAASSGPAATPERGALDAAGDLLEWAASAWTRWFDDTGTPPPPKVAPGTAPAVSPAAGEPAAQPAGDAAAAQTPIDVIAHHNALGTFGQKVTVNSTKRDGAKQLVILRNYCKQWKTQLDSFAGATPWLKDSLDWAAFDKAGVADEAVWLPFFFALYIGGGGPGVKSDERTLPLVAAPAQTTWTDKQGKSRTANASPHIAGRAMDVDAADLEALESSLNKQIPEFSPTGAFPIKSLQPETTAGQTAVHINFKNVVFP